MQFVLEGGFPMALAGLAFLLGLAICVAQLVLLRRWDLTPLVACATLATGLVGLFGFTYGFWWGLQAMIQAGPDAVAVPLARGVAMALNSALLAAVLAAVQALIGGLVVTLRQLLVARSASPAGEVAP
jgi:hypothetical protein